MADSPENNRRPLPRVNSNETRELQKRARETDKKVQTTINDIRTLGQKTDKAEQEQTETTRQVGDLKKRFQKQEQDVAQLQNDVAATDKKADKALKDSKTNTQKLNKLERSGSILNIKNQFSDLQRNFGTSSKNLSQSVNTLQTNFSSSLLNYTSSEQQTGQRLTTLEDSVTNLDLQLNIFKTDFAKSLQIITADNLQDKQSILGLTASVDGLKKNELADEKDRQKQLRITAADKRREIKENILEGSKNALKKTGSALSKTTNSLLGGFNLIDAIKSVLSKLAFGLLIVKFPELYKNITENMEEWKRVSALFIKSFLRPISTFFNAVIDVGLKITKWVFKGVNLIRKAIGSIVGFTFNAGRKLISAVVNFLGDLFRLKPKPPRPGVDSGTKPPKPSSGASPSGAPGTPKPPRPSGYDGVGADTGETATPKPKGRMSRVADWIKEQGRRAGSAVMQSGDALTGGGFTKLKEQVTAYLKKASDLTKPLFSAVSSAKSAISQSIKNKDPKALRDGISDLFTDVQGKSKALGSKLDEFLAPIFRLIRPFGDVGFGLLRGLGREARIGLPIDMLINKYVLGQDWGESIIRAVGSTLGTFAFAGIPIPGTGIVGGDLGDYLIARSARDLFGVKEGFAYDANLVNLIPGFSGLMDNVFGSTTGADSGMNKALSPAVSASSAANNITKTNASPSISSAPTTGSNTPVSQYLRKPTPKAATPAMGVPSAAGDGSPSVAQITLPAQTVDMPPQVIGDKGESIDRTPAQSIPSISPTNPAMDYLQIAAANTFEMQLV